MKKTITCAMMAMLMACYCHAAIYIVGNDPFGDWNPTGGVEMTDNGDGIYTYSAVVNGSIWFVFADGLSSDWTTFNNDFRYGPSNGDQTVTVGTWVTTQKAGDHGAYLFTGSGETYTFTFNNNNKQFQIEGYVTPGNDEYTVAGAPASIFGTEWDINNPDNLMTKGSDGLYYWTRSAITLQGGTIVEFKVVQNHDWASSWPASNWYCTVEADGIYDLAIAFDPVTCLITLTATLVEEVDPAEVPDVYILGEVNGIGWRPDQGLLMQYDSSSRSYSAQFTAKKSPGEQWAYFGLTRKLASPTSSNPWEEINEYRFGPVSDGNFIVTSDKLSQYFPLATDGSYNSFAIPEGTWTLNVDLINNRFSIKGQAHPVDAVTYTVAGTQSVFGSDWDATDAANDMTNNGGVYVWKKQNVTLQAPGFEFKVVGNHDWGYFEWPEGYGNNYYVSVPHDGTYTVTITFDPNGADGPSLSCSIEENVEPGTPGDMNGDGEITIADVNLLIDAILSSSVDYKYDFNHDGEINVADVTSLINLLLMDSSIKHLSGEIRFDVDEGTVFIYYTGNENVTLTVHVDGVETPLQNGCFHLNEYGEHLIEVVAKARGYYDLTTSFTYYWQESEPDVTPEPEITFDEEDDYVVVTAHGKGEVSLYVDGEQVSNPCMLERTDVEYEVYISAFAQEEGKLISNEVAMSYIVMPRYIGPIEEKTTAPYINASQDYSSDYGGIYITVTIEGAEPSVIYYRIGVMEDGEYYYGEWMEYTDAIILNEYGSYMVEAYAVAPDKLPSDHVFDGFYISPPVGNTTGKD